MKLKKKVRSQLIIVPELAHYRAGLNFAQKRRRLNFSQETVIIKHVNCVYRHSLRVAFIRVHSCVEMWKFFFY